MSEKISRYCDICGALILEGEHYFKIIGRHAVSGTRPALTEADLNTGLDLCESCKSDFITWKNERRNR